MDQIDWQPGEEGKGIVDENGHVHAWNEDDYETHHDFIQEHPHLGSPRAYFYITPKGEIDVSNPSAGYDPRGHQLMTEYICEVDPHFIDSPHDRWSF